MNKKTTIVFGIILILILGVCVLNYAKKENVNLGGTSNFDSDVVINSGYTFTVTDGAVTFGGNLTTDGGLIIGGVKDYGNAVSTSFSASDICDNYLIRLEPDYADETGASISFPDDETLAADCLGDQGDMVEFEILNGSTSGSANLGVVTTGLVYNVTSGSLETIDPSNVVKVEGLNYDGTSISWRFWVEALSE
jgi:hypothetical protein